MCLFTSLVAPLGTSIDLLGTPLLGASMWFGRIWYSLPLVLAISLVYSATRHEAMKPILDHALRFGLWVVGFMILVFAVLAIASLWL